MATKNDKYSFIGQSFTTSKNQYYNLNLNQSEKCATLIPVQFNSKPNNNKYNVSDNYEEKEKLQSWNKSSKVSAFATFNEDNNDLKKCWKKENTLNTNNKSTLSLHIEAYKNPIASELFGNENIEGLKREKFGSIKKRCFTDNLKSRNPFEFPRQQNGYEPLGENNFFTAPDHTPVPPPSTKKDPEPGRGYFEPPSKEPVLPPPSAAPESSQKSQNGSGSQSQKGSCQSTDLRDEESKRKKSKNKQGSAEEKKALLNREAEKDEETTRLALRLQRFQLQQQKKAKRTKTCIFIASAVLIIVGLILTALILSVFFTECFGYCKNLSGNKSY
uniref:Uncharacterized protein n=1 Tax=Panagrolaimus sp. PS1159 TaxID=55785 RepID=A0AC35GXS8_9BILA